MWRFGGEEGGGAKKLSGPVRLSGLSGRQSSKWVHSQVAGCFVRAHSHCSDGPQPPSTFFAGIVPVSELRLRSLRAGGGDHSFLLLFFSFVVDLRATDHFTPQRRTPPAEAGKGKAQAEREPLGTHR